MLTGSEVKSLREGKAQIAESYAGSTTTSYGSIRCTCRRGSTPWALGVTTRSTAKALGPRHELDQWLHETRTEPYTMVPLKVYSAAARRKSSWPSPRVRSRRTDAKRIAKRDSRTRHRRARPCDQ